MYSRWEDEILASLGYTRVIYQPIDRTRASTAPLTDKQVLEEIAALLLEGETVSIEHKLGE